MEQRKNQARVKAWNARNEGAKTKESKKRKTSDTGSDADSNEEPAKGGKKNSKDNKAKESDPIDVSDEDGR